MIHRSRVHMLTVAAARLESDYANPKLVADLRAAAKEESVKRADGRGYSVCDERRVERQRTLFAMCPDLAAVERLKAAMMQRAYDLMWDGDCSACDAILEFLPAKDATRVLDAWANDQDPNRERTPFYGENHV